MWRNYLAAALRNLARNKLYTAVSLGGLCVGFIAALLIALYVHHELTYDQWMPGYRQLYLVQGSLVRKGTPAPRSWGVNTDAKLTDSLKLEYPEIAAITRLVPESHGLRSRNSEGEEKIFWAEPNVFSVLPLKLLTGDPAAALSRPDSIVLSRAQARKYFGREDPIGAPIELDRHIPLRVTAILEDLPSNTHLNAQILISSRSSFSPFDKDQEITSTVRQFGLGGTSSHAYIKLQPHASISTIEAGMPDFRHRHPAPPDFSQMWLSFLNVADIHFKANSYDAMKPQANVATLSTLAAVGLLILLLAGFNFVNMMTARATRRAIEVGIRKVTGASRGNLIGQFVGESILHVALAMLLAIAVAEAVLPAFNAFLDQKITIGYAHPQFIAAALGATLVFGVLAGVYPAFVLSSFQPSGILKRGSPRAGGSVPLRQMLVVLQFAAFVGMLVVTLVIFRQIDFARNQALRFDRDPMLLVNTTCPDAFKQEITRLPGVLGAACSFAAPTQIGTESIQPQTQDGKNLTAEISSVDFGFFELYGIKPLAGRLFERARAADISKVVDFDFTPASVVLNATAVRAFGFASPQAAIGQTIRGIRLAMPVIGVVPDIMVGSVRDEIAPVMYFIEPSRYQLMSIKLSGAQIPATLQAIDRLWNRFAEKPMPVKRRFLDEYVQSLYVDITRQATLLAAFATVAAFIACLSLFGVSAFTAERRTKEIGIRKATGAKGGNILTMLLWQFTRPVIWANTIAWPAAYFIMRRWLDGFAYRVDLQAWIFMAAALLALAIAGITVLTHALLVARAKPVEALRYE